MVNNKIKGYINKNKKGNNIHVLPDMIHTFFLKNEGKSLKYIYIYEVKTVKISKIFVKMCLCHILLILCHKMLMSKCA